MNTTLSSPKKKNVGNFLQLMKTSLRYQTGEFMRNSTLHGIAYIAEENRPFHEKFVWFSFLLTGSIATLVIIISLWEKFQTSPTITGLDTDFHSWDVPFPAITICPKNPTDNSRVEQYITAQWGNVTFEKSEYYKKFLEELAMSSFNNLENMEKYVTGKNLPRDQLRQIVSQIAIRCEDLISNCFFKGEQINCCNEFLPIFTDQGLCYSFNSKYFDRDLWNDTDNRRQTNRKVYYIYETDSELYISFLISNENPGPFVIYIHSADESIGQDLPPQHIWNRRVQKISFMPKATYTTEDTRQLSIRQRHCIFPDEVTLMTNDVYTFSACMAQCRMQISYDNCGCIPFFYKEIGKFKHCDLEGLACLSKYKRDIIKGWDCDCELGCTTTVYEIEKLDDARMEVTRPLQITFVSWPMIQYKRDVLFGWVDLFVAFGGIAGLFLGFSLLSAIEIVYYITLRACCMVHTSPEEVTKIQENYENTPESEINLDMTPTFLKSRNKKNELSTTTTTKHDNEVKKHEIFVLPYLP